MARYRDPVFHRFLHLFVNICDNPSTLTLLFGSCFSFPVTCNYQTVHVIDLNSHWRILRTPDPGQETEANLVWPCFKVFWFNKDTPAGYSERKKKKRQIEEEVGRQYQRVDRNGLCQLS